jgi:hypothetical protein
MFQLKQMPLIVNTRVILALIVGWALVGITNRLEAQIRYQPKAGPTLPSQLSYFRRDVGLLDQYNTFIQPQRQLEAQLQQMTQQQQADYRSAQRKIEQIKEIRPSGAAPTGVGGGYLNYLHYYRLPAGGGGRPRGR